MKLRRASRWLLLLGAGAAAGVLALAGATGLVLRSDWLLGQIDGDPDSLFVTFTQPRASLVPGRIRFATLTLRSRDQNVEWEARLEDVTVNVALRSLTERRFRAETVSAAALTFRLRERLAPGEATLARAGRYPPIPGYRDPPLRDQPKPPAAPGNPWCVVVDDLRVELVREIWIDAWRWEGKGRLSGGLFLRPGIEAEVLPSALDVEGGTLRWGAHVSSRMASGRIQASLPRFDTQASPGNEVWKIMSGSASLSGTLESLAFLAPLGGGPRIEAGGAGTVRARVALQAGRGSARFDAGAPAVIAKLGAREARGSVRANVYARRIDFPGATIAFDGTKMRLRNVRTGDAAGAPWSADLEARTATLRLPDGSIDASLFAHLGDARPLVALVPGGPPRWIAGLLDLRDFEATGRLRAGPGSLALSPSHAQAGSFSIDADWREKGAGGWGALLVRKGGLSLGLGLGSGAPSVHLAGAASWFEAEGRPGGLRTDQARGSAGVVRPSR